MSAAHSSGFPQRFHAMTPYPLSLSENPDKGRIPEDGIEAEQIP